METFFPNILEKERKMDSKKVLIVDDEPAVRDVLSSFLGEYALETVAAGTGEEALLMLHGNTISVALVDIKLPGMDGMQLLGAIKEVYPDTEVVIMTSYASIDTAIDAIRKDAYDYLQKPFETSKVCGLPSREPSRKGSSP
jgi:DNA-binding NtrC family response regulator